MYMLFSVHGFYDHGTIESFRYILNALSRIYFDDLSTDLYLHWAHKLVLFAGVDKLLIYRDFAYAWYYLPTPDMTQGQFLSGV